MQQHHSIRSLRLNSHFLLALLFEELSPSSKPLRQMCCLESRQRPTRRWTCDAVWTRLKYCTTPRSVTPHKATLTQHMILSAFESMPSKKLAISMIFRVRLYLASMHIELLLSLLNQSVTHAAISRCVCHVNTRRYREHLCMLYDPFFLQYINTRCRSKIMQSNATAA